MMLPLFLLFSGGGLAALQDTSSSPELQSSCPKHEVKLDKRAYLPLHQVTKFDAFKIAVSYDLDGSGKARNLNISEASPSDRFDKAFLKLISKSRFEKGVIGTGCVYQGEFHKRR